METVLRVLWVAVALSSAACGMDVPGFSKKSQSQKPANGISDLSPATDPLNYTPGFFRELVRVQNAQEGLSDEVAAARWQGQFASRAQSALEIPVLDSSRLATLEALLLLGYRVSQATQHLPQTSKTLAETLAVFITGLDPAIATWNNDHPTNPIAMTIPGVAAFSATASWILTIPEQSLPETCRTIVSEAAQFVAGEPQNISVPEHCEPDRIVGGYCESDHYVDEVCESVWVPDECLDGHYENRGRYDYRCFGPTDCRMVWVPDYVYVDGYCYDGYYEDRCYGGYYEPGLCYNGTLIPGACVPAHTDTLYPNGSWVFADVNTPAECSEIRLTQHALAKVAMLLLIEQFYHEVSSETQSALDSFIDVSDINALSEAQFQVIWRLLEDLR